MTTRARRRRRAWTTRVAIVALLVIAAVLAILVLPRLRSQAPPAIDDATRRAIEEAQAHFGAGRIDQAIAIAEAQLAREPEAAGLHYVAGAALQAKGEHARAAEHLRAEIERSPQHFDSRLRLAASLTEIGETDEANAALRAALELQPEQSRASYLLGRNLARAGKTADAERLLLQAAQSGEADAWYELGLLYRKRDDLAGAEDALRRALAASPDHLEATFALGQTLVRAGKEDEGQRFLGRHAELESRGDKLELLRHYALEEGEGAEEAANFARYLLLQHDLGGAISAYRQAIERDPDLAAARIGLGQALLEQGGTTEAARELEQAVERAPNDAEAHFYLGLARHLERDYTGAQQSFTRSRALRPWSAKEYLFLGNVLAGSGALADAEKAYRASLAAGPEIPEARYQLGLALERGNRAAEARPELERFVELEARDPRGRLLLGVAEHGAGDLAAADATFRAALDRLEVAVPDPAERQAMLDDLRDLPGAGPAIERLEALRRERAPAAGRP